MMYSQGFCLRIHVQGLNYSYRLRTLVAIVINLHPATNNWTRILKENNGGGGYNVLQIKVKLLIFLIKRIIEMSLQYGANSCRNCWVLKVLYKCVIVIWCQSTHVATQSDILFICILRKPRAHARGAFL